MNESFTKLCSSIVTSTIWSEDNYTRIVWITMLATCDHNGDVPGSIPGLARIAKVPFKRCEAALQKLLSPDPYSRTKEHEGRRIVEIPGGWHIINREKYRAARNTDDRREYQRQWDRDHRPSGWARQNQSKENEISDSKTHSPTQSDAVLPCPTQTETETEIEIETEINKAEEKEKRESRRFTAPSPFAVTEYARSIEYALDGQQFVDHYTARGWKIGKTPMKDWRAAVRTWKQRDRSPPAAPEETVEQILARLKAKGKL